MAENLDLWYGWIPTNRGKINFSFISEKNLRTIAPKQIFSFEKTKNQIDIKSLEISATSDSSNFNKYKKNTNKNIVELMTYTDVELRNNENLISGNIKVRNDEKSFYSNFSIQLNGEICFSTDDDFFIKDKDKSLIKTLMYIIIKTIIHGDSHHHQKIDIALQITENSFDKNKIVDTFLDYIKLVERNIKGLNNCESKLRSETAVEEIKGYISYLKTFNQLFKDDTTNFDKEIRIAENLHESLKATVDKRKTKQAYKVTIITTLITFIGIFVSINILFNGFWEQCNSDIVVFFEESSRFEYLRLSFLIIFITFILNIQCFTKSIVYFKYYDYFEIAFFIKNSSYKDLNFKGKFIKLLPIIFILSAIIASRNQILALVYELISKF